MTSSPTLLRTLLIYCICLPLAIVLGYLITTPSDFSTMVIVGLVLSLLAFPLFIRWNHVWLLAAWNTSLVVFFLPGRPPLWMVLAAGTLAIGFLQYFINRKMKFLSVPSLARPIIFLTLVVLVTARLTGGIGLRSFGGETIGGRRYVAIFAAVAGYFALISRPIPRGREWLYMALFLLGTATQGVGELVSVLGPASYFIGLVFPIQAGTVSSILSVEGSSALIHRLAGFTVLSVALFCLMLARYRIQDIFSWRRAWRFLLLALFVAVGMMGGFRSLLISFLLTFGIIFYLEGLMRTRYLPIFGFFILLAGVLTIPYVDRMPYGIQRSLSFLPVPVDPLVRMDADASSKWRIEVWRDVLPEIPKHLLLGKGLAIKAEDLAASQLGQLLPGNSTEGTELAGDYHNGPLSVIIPFGIFGVIGFLWLLRAGVRVLYCNYQYGNPELRIMNRFILAYFMAKIILFFFVFGGFYGDLAQFAGLLGLSVSLNGGMAKPATAPQPERAAEPVKFPAPVRQPVRA